MAHHLAAGSHSVLLKMQTCCSKGLHVRSAGNLRCAKPLTVTPFGTCRNTLRNKPSTLQAVRADQQAETLDAAVVQAIASITQAVDESVKATLMASADAAKTVEVTADSEIRSKVVNGVEKLQIGLLERETEVGAPWIRLLQSNNVKQSHTALWRITSKLEAINHPMADSRLHFVQSCGHSTTFHER